VTILPAPDPGLRACIVVPARDEEELIGACVRALAAQEGVAGEAYELLLVLDRCTDATEARARAAAGSLVFYVLRTEQPGVGAARRVGMDLACERLHSVGRPDGLIACTDADSEAAPDWLATQLAAVAGGARAIGGRAAMSEAEQAALDPAIRASRERDAAARLELARSQAMDGARTEHHQFSGASMALTAATYRLAGPLERRTGLEDEALERLLRRHRVPVDRLLAVRVTTSGRSRGRAPRGLALDLRRARWLAARRYDGAGYDAAALAERKTATVSVVLPTREATGTVGDVLDALAPLKRARLLDEILVVRGGSRDGTAGVARRRGAWVADESELLREYGPALGTGDALWRGLAATSGDLVVFVRAHAGFRADLVTGLLGPLLRDPAVELVKGAYEPAGRDGLGELVARPLLNLHLPDLAGFVDPLGFELAARRTMLERLPFPVGDGVEIALLIDAYRTAGLDGLAQADLGERPPAVRHDAAKALAVIAAVERRIHGAARSEADAPGPLLLPFADGFEPRSVALDERPPLLELLPAAVGAQSLRPV